MATQQSESIEIDEHARDSDYDSLSSCGSDLTSLSSSVVNYQYENGRRYHNYRSGRYVLPNDDAEQERLDLAHHAWGLLMRGALYDAPLDKKKVKRILDLGTGTGIWACEIGDEFPDATVIGTDLSPIQPTWVPPNVSFIVDDFEDTWMFDEKFDYIHGRNLVGAVKDWDGLFAKIFKATKAGGYVEFQESDITGVFSEDDTFKGSKYEVYQEHLKKASEILGNRMDVAPQVSEFMKKAGFVDVHVRRIRWPFGVWPKDRRHKELGRWGYEILSTGCEAYGLALFTRALGMDPEKAKEIIKGAVEDLGGRKVHTQEWQYVVYGRKPGDGSESDSD